MARNWDTIREVVIASVNPFRRRRKTSELEALIEEWSSLTEPAEMPRRIAACREALSLVDRNGQPELWADLHAELGKRLTQYPQGKRAENIEEVISHHEQALEVYTRQDSPQDWARTQRNLACAYQARVRGDRSQNPELVIFHHKQALKVFANEDFLLEWAAIQNGLAIAYRGRILGDRAQNIEEVISHHEQALEVYTRQDSPQDWARTQRNLACAYQARVRGERAQNLDEVISHYEQALEVKDFPMDQAMTYHSLADAYQQRIRGGRAQNLELAISHYEQALEVRMRGMIFPADWATTQNNLAIAYENRIRGQKADNIEKSISHHEQALEVRTRQSFPEEWAATQNNLAIAYCSRIRGDRAQNIEEAIFCCEQALEVRTKEDFPEKWAATQNHLAIAYENRIGGESAENIEEAIFHFQQALDVYTRQGFPEEWAATQNNLAIAYCSRIRGDRAQNIEEAIFRCEQALEVRTREDFPEEWGGIQKNLADAYRGRVRGDRAQNIEEAILCCEHALEVYTRQAFPEEWAATQNGLAAAYRGRILGDRAQNIERAISRYEQALEVRTREDFPVRWATTQNDLAAAYSNRIRGEKAENLDEAIEHYEQALEVYTRQDFPVQWGMTQHNLALAYSDRTRGERSQNVEEAISRFELALEVRTPQTLPQDCRNTAYSLGRLLYGEGRFTEARGSLATAHEAVEALRGELVREGAKQELAEENADLYARLVHCCLIEGDEQAAFEYAVAGKGRAFVDLLATARFDLSAAGADDPQLGENLRQARELRQQIDNLLAWLTGEDGTSLKEDGEEQRGAVQKQMQASLRSLKDQEAAHWEELSFRYPALTATQQAPTLSVGDAQRLSEEIGATLVECYRHAGGWCAFVVTFDGVGHVSLPAVNDELLAHMGKWLERIESPDGRGKLSYKPLHRLHRALIAPLRDYLPPSGRVVLAPFADLHLIPSGAALDPDTGRYAAEEYTLTFAPNLAALRTARQNASPAADWDGEESLLSVAYPDVPGSEYHLPNVLPEAEAVARHFSRVTALYEEDATPDAVLSHARGQDVLHLGCHGNFDADSPQQSGLKLSEGRLTVQRIITALHLQETRLATIGACLSGRVEVRQGEENIGLVQAMMSAGAGAVVASLWPVDDAATRTLLEVFYAEVASGGSPAGALAKAGAFVRSRPGWEHPYYWAAFQVSGLAHGPYEPGLSNLSDEVV